MSRLEARPRVLLGTRSLNGLSFATRDRILGVTSRYREPDALAVTISRALDAGADGILASPSHLLAGAIERLRRRVPWYAVVPGLSEQERFELEPGVEPLLGRRLGRAGSSAGVRMALARFARPAALYAGDWSVRLPVLIESEIAAVGTRDLRGVVLDAWITDFALAARNARLFATHVRFVRSRFRSAAGFETHNLGVLLARLREWNVEPDFVLAPINPVGRGMKPSPEEALAEVRGTSIHVVAKELCAGTALPLAEAARYARDRGASGLAPDLCEVGDAAVELKALMG